MLRWLLPLVFVLTWGRNSFASDVEPVRLWHAYRGGEQAALDRAVEAFEESSGVEVEVLQLPHDAYASKLAAAAPGGAGPDVFIDAHERFGDYIRRGVVMPLPASIDASPFPRGAVDALTIDGKLYGMPLALKALVLYINTDLLKEAPETVEALIDTPLPAGVFPLVYEANDAYYHAAFLHAFGARQLNADGSFGFSGPEAVRSIEFVRDLMRRGKIPEEAGGSVVKQLFISGKAAAYISGPWSAGELDGKVNYRAVPLPELGATGKPLEPYLTVEAAALTPRGAKNAQALRLIQYLAGPESAEIRVKVGRQLVALRKLPPAAADDPFIQAFATQAEHAVPMPSGDRMRTSWEPANRALKKALSGAVTPQAALEEATRRFDDMVRPPPPPASPTPLLLLLGGLSLLGAFRIWRRAERGELWSPIKRSLPAYLWVTHAVIAVGVLVFVPIFVGAAASLYAGPQGNMHYVGLANFWEILTARGAPLLSSGSFYLVLLVTILWTLLNVGLHLLIGFSLGLLLSRPTLRLKPFYRVLLILPWAVPSYVTALAWRGMFDRQFGAVSAILESIGVEPFSWWAQFSTAFAANVSTNVWLGFPFMMVVTLGALTGVPKDVLEAAEVDGATRWQRLRLVTIPMVKPVLGPAVLLGSIWTFNMFNVVFLVSGGEPDGTTEILVSEAYRWAFTRQAQYGYAAAYSVLIFLLLFFGSRLMNRPRSLEAA
ncbi:MAG: extracellular solute-binding protein [Polyangiaceae bacterium]